MFGRGSDLLFLLSVVLTSILAIAYITIAKAPIAEAATVPIQTCSGISSSASTTSTNLGNPIQSVTVMVPHPAMQTMTVSKTITVPNPAHTPGLSPGDPGYVGPTKQKTLTKTKQVWGNSGSDPVTISADLSVSPPGPPSPGPPDTSRNLTTQTTSMSPAQASGVGSWFTTDNVGEEALSVTFGGSYATPAIPDGATYSAGRSFAVTGGTRKSDGASTRSSPPNYYDQGTIEAWRWSGSWQSGATRTQTYLYVDAAIFPDTSYDGGPGSVAIFSSSVTLSNSASARGNISGCTRTLVVAPPTCTAKLRSHPDNASTSWAISGAPYATETFDPNVEHGGGGQTISVFPVGPNNSRSAFILRNVNNLFELGTSGSSYSYSGASPYGSGRSPSASGQGRLPVASDGTLGSYLNGADWNSVVSSTLETDNSINFPGKYRVTWTPSWSSRGSSAGWNGSELSGSVCRYKGPPYANGSGTADPTEGPQSRPSDGTVVNSLSLNVYVFADPPTCTVGDFLFEVNEPIVPKVTLSNPNNAPMWVDVADSNISRLGFSRTDVSGAAGLTVPANGDLYIFPTVPSINHSGEFVLNWKIQTNMGNETWTTLGTPRPPQRSWFEDPEERIVDSLASACEVTISKVVYLPFIKVFYGSLAAGGRFGDKVSYDACGENFDHVLGEDSNALINNSFVAGHAEGTTPSTVRGSSVEYALQANNIIGGFYSASQRSLDPQPLKGLTFSNNDIFHAYGGGFGKQACIANYWREVEKLTAEPASPNLDLSWLQNNDRQLYEADPPGSSLEIENTRTPDSLNLKATIYVDGDVYITDDIINNDANTPKWYNPSQIGYLSIIARGDINIAPDVKQIDAVLVAYPKEDSGGNIVAGTGTIRTCYASHINAGNHFGECGEQLVVNGALIAEKVLFGRVFASVKQEIDFPADSGNTKASEVINLLPEYFIGIPELPLFPDQVYKTDSVSTQPVNF